VNRPELRLHGDRLRSNIEAIGERIAPSALMVVMKDDAYGHGLVWAVETAERAGVSWYGSYDVAGGVEIRRVLERPARVFAWATATDDEIDEALYRDIDLGVGTQEYLERVVSRARVLGRRARVHLKIDTGLHRNGILPEDWTAAIATVRAAEQAGLAEFVGVWSHLAEASDAEDDDARAAFVDAVRVTRETGDEPAVLHLTASAASWWRPELRGTLSRIGAFCYGIRSADGPDLDGLRPVAELVARVTAVEGDGVEISIGAFDGVPSTLAGVAVGTPAGARVLREIGETASIVEGWPGASVGDLVHLFGAGDHGEGTATDLAERIGTVGEEILTRLTPRVRRVVVDEGRSTGPGQH